MRIYKEITNDRGIAKHALASNNHATYVITSAPGHDKVREYLNKWQRLPSAAWFNRHFNFQRVK